MGEAAFVSNHTRVRHRVLRNQLNGESRAEGWKGLKKERKKELGASEQTAALSSG
jgi:hypothetical protein